MIRKTVRAILSFSMVLSSMPGTAPDAFAAEDAYYLQNEIRETEAKYKIVHDALVRMDEFLKNYPGMVESLGKAYDELDALEKRMRDLLQKNLIKSTIKLGFDTYQKVNLVLGFAQQSIKLIILACACEYASDQMQDSMLSPYKKVVQGLSEGAQKLLPEIAEVQKTLSMDAIDLKIKVMREGENPDDLGETGLIYRKFYYVLEAIENAKKKIYELRKNLDRTKADIDSERPRVAEEDDRLGKRLEELKKRLSAAEIEMAAKKDGEINSAGKEKGKINITPAPAHVKDEAERQALIASYQTALYNIEAAGRKKFEEIGAELNKEAKASFKGGNHNPLEGKSSSYALPELLAPQVIRGMGPQELTQEMNFYGVIIKVNDDLLPVIRRYPVEYDNFVSSLKGEATPVMNALAGLGVSPGSYNVEYLTASASSQSISLNKIIARIPEENDVYKKNITAMRSEFDNKVSKARGFVQRYSTGAADVVNAAIFAVNKGKAVIVEAKAAGFEDSASAYRHLAKLRKQVAEMFDSGADGAKVKAFLEEERKKFAVLGEPASRAGHLAALALNTRWQFEEKVNSDPDLGLVRVIAEGYPEQGVINPENKYGEDLWDVDMNGNPRVREDIFNKCAEIANASFGVANEINDFISFLPKIDEINLKVRNEFASSDYVTAMGKRAVIASTLNAEADRPILDQWLKAYASPDGGKTPAIYKIFSAETNKAIEASMKIYEARMDAEYAAKRDEEKRKEEEERKKREKEDAEKSGYRVYDVRVNTLTIPNVPGEMVLTSSELRDNTIEITAWLDNLYGIKTVLISEDGSVFKEIPVDRQIRYSFHPVPGKQYIPRIKLKFESDEKVFDLLSNGQTLVYRDIDHTVLIRDAVKELADSYESKNIANVSSLISRDFLGNKIFLEEGIRFDFDMFDDIRLTIFIDRIEKNNALFIAETRWQKTQTPKKTGQQQRTSGSTRMIFLLEDGKMKIYNLKGNLIYATLSPEIASSSGLGEAVVEAIRVDRDTRNPEQPGSGATQETGGVSSVLSVRTGTVTSVDLPMASNMDRGFFFSSGAQADAVGDFVLEFPNLLFTYGNAKIQDVSGTYTFDSLSTAPDITNEVNGPATAGKVYLLVTQEGYYAKMRIDTVNADQDGMNDDDMVTMTFTYAVQTDGSRDLRTN
ncbi:MAG: hypothetical protein HQL30_04465 [Candidatus Omnitrophica bacterium]|nr:hypothetical protein [Candidatus Omnitrophota bacterium]